VEINLKILVFLQFYFPETKENHSKFNNFCTIFQKKLQKRKCELYLVKGRFVRYEKPSDGRVLALPHSTKQTPV
jgi:hypothetical protein